MRGDSTAAQRAPTDRKIEFDNIAKVIITN